MLVTKFALKMTNKPQDVDLTTHQAAKMMGVTIRTIQNWVNAGKLPANVTVGGHRRIPLAAVEALLTHRQRTKSRLHDKDRLHRVLKVLAVDDDPTLLKLYQVKFRKFLVPHELQVTSDGQQALVMLGLQRPDILLLDLMMPGMNGFDLLRTLGGMTDFSDLMIVVVSALSASEILQQGGLPAGVAIVPKPVPFEILETIFAQKATQSGFDMPRASVQ